jgi:hypothetical protein
MDQRWERQLVYFALSFLDADQMDGCNNTKIIWQKQTKDLSLIKPGESHAILWQDLANPFGTTFAAMRLWKDIQGMRLAKSPKPQ